MTKELDISSEEYRIYTYAGGETYRIDFPVVLFIIEDGGPSHRVVDKNGVTHRPERGWVAISWKPNDGEPAFVA